MFVATPAALIAAAFALAPACRRCAWTRQRRRHYRSCRRTPRCANIIRLDGRRRVSGRDRVCQASRQSPPSHKPTCRRSSDKSPQPSENRPRQHYRHMPPPSKSPRRSPRSHRRTARKLASTGRQRPVKAEDRLRIGRNAGGVNRRAARCLIDLPRPFAWRRETYRDRFAAGGPLEQRLCARIGRLDRRRRFCAVNSAAAVARRPSICQGATAGPTMPGSAAIFAARSAQSARISALTDRIMQARRRNAVRLIIAIDRSGSATRSVISRPPLGWLRKRTKRAARPARSTRTRTTPAFRRSPTASPAAPRCATRRQGNSAARPSSPRAACRLFTFRHRT